MKNIFVLIVCIVILACTGFAELEPYKDKTLPINERVKDLLKRMTLEEKIAQMSNFQMNAVSIIEAKKSDINIEKVLKGISYGTMDDGYTSEEIGDVASRMEAFQDYLLHHSRLGIPAIMTSTAIHGLMAHGWPQHPTIFPHLCAMGSTWNKTLIEKTAAAIALETSATGYAQDLGPNLDLAVDPRWGRVEECFSQDPFLVAEMGIAYITGMQGDIRNGSLGKDKVFTTIKHFAGYSKPLNGINIAPSSMGEREIRTFLYPYKRVIDSFGQWSVMPSYHALNNIPCHSSSFLLRDILRKEMGFDGYVYSDWGAVEMLHEPQRVAESNQEAAMKAVKAGVNLEAPGPATFKFLKESVEKGELEEAYIDSAVADILRIKFRAGLFDGKRPFSKQHLDEVLHSQKHIDIAREVAEEVCILLTNNNHTLPLDENKIKSIGLIGPNAAHVQFGDYTFTHEDKYGVTVLQGIENYVGSKAKIVYAKGCGITNFSKEGFNEAINVAKQSDVVIMVCGGSSNISGGIGGELNGDKSHEFATCGEGFDRPVLNLPGIQEDLIREVKKTGKPIVLVLINGRPYTIPWLKENMNAILEAWYPGEQGGNAIANLLFGKVNPSGKTTQDWPQTSGHIYTQYNYLPVSRGYYNKPGSLENPGRDYVDYSTDALFPFGYGLSYTTFEYRNLVLKDTVLEKSENLEAEVTIKNTGEREGKEVVQLYISDDFASVTVPAMELKWFKKIALEPGESKKVHFKVPIKELALWNSKMEHVVESGRFEVMIGESSDQIMLKSSFKVR